MVRACRKVKSKRLTCHKKYKIIKKVKEHNRKLRKEAKTNPLKFKRKDPGIPHSLPFKEDLLKHVDETKKKFEEIRKNQMIAALKAKTMPQEVKPKFMASTFNSTNEFRSVISNSDVILEVLDARDPIGTRCIQAEQEIAMAKKKLVIILNKIDLVPSENVKQWLDYFRQWYATLPFKANTQEQNANLGSAYDSQRFHLNAFKKRHKSSLGFGVDALRALLGNYARSFVSASKDNKAKKVGKLTVGIVGLPNTGKSAIVNTLKRKRVSPSSNVPGLTKKAQLFQLDNHLYLYDSPGMVLSKASDENELALKNCIAPQNLEDPYPAVEAILRRVPKRQLIIKYSIKEYASTSDFLVQVALRFGKLKRGGVPNTLQAARTVLQDWITGKITYHTLPPEDKLQHKSSVIAETIAVEKLDLPLADLDSKTFESVQSNYGEKNILECPAAVLTDSQPISSEFANDMMNKPDEDEEMDADYDEDSDEEISDEDEIDSEDDEHLLYLHNS